MVESEVCIEFGSEVEVLVLGVGGTLSLFVGIDAGCDRVDIGIVELMEIFRC